jgi:glycoprotein-N-acetylgalactosamine 3-beta-galactosyltransferase
MCWVYSLASKPSNSQNLSAQVQQGIDYVRRVHAGQFDWFMRIDDDAYVIMENLIMFLRTRRPSAPEMYRHMCPVSQILYFNHA